MLKKRSKPRKPEYVGLEPRKGLETRERKFALIDRINSLRRAKLDFIATGDRVSRWPRAFAYNKKLDGNRLQLIGTIKVGDKTTYYYVDRRTKKGTVLDRKNKQ